MNRGEYARQFGRWGEHLIDQLGKGHQDGQTIGKDGHLTRLKQKNRGLTEAMKTEYRKRRKSKYKFNSQRQWPASDSFKTHLLRIFRLLNLL